MLGRLSRAAAAVLMVGLIAGAAVAFSTGVPLHSAATCNNEISYGATCPGNPLRKVRVTVNATRSGPLLVGTSGRISITLRNPTNSTVTGTLTLSYVTGATSSSATSARGQRKLVREKFRIGPHKTIHLSVSAPGLRRGTMVIRLKDRAGNTLTIVRRVRGRVAVRQPSFAG